MKYLLLLSLVVWIAYADVENLDFSTNNIVENVHLEKSEIIQGSIFSYKGNIYESNIEFISKFKNSLLDLNSFIYQNILILNNATLEESSMIAKSSIDGLIGHNALVKQSIIYMDSGTTIENGSKIILNNSLFDVKMNESVLSQGEVYLRNTTMNDVELLSRNRFFSQAGDSLLEYANVVQGAYIIEDSRISNSNVETQTILVDTEVNGAFLNMCSTYIKGATLSNVRLKKNCFMKDSKISNGANLSYGNSQI
jgi:hypothetical protein